MHRHLVVEGQADLATVTYLLNETDIVSAENLPAALAQFQAEVEVDAVDEELVGEAAHGLPGLEAHHVACGDGVFDVFGAGGVLRVQATQVAVFDARTDDGDIGLIGITAELLEHVGLDDGVLVEGEEPTATLSDGPAAELIECGGDAEVRGVLDKDGAFGKGADIGHVARAVIDEDQGDRSMIRLEAGIKRPVPLILCYFWSSKQRTMNIYKYLLPQTLLQ